MHPTQLRARIGPCCVDLMLVRWLILQKCVAPCWIWRWHSIPVIQVNWLLLIDTWENIFIPWIGICYTNEYLCIEFGTHSHRLLNGQAFGLIFEDAATFVVVVVVGFFQCRTCRTSDNWCECTLYLCSPHRMYIITG